MRSGLLAGGKTFEAPAVDEENIQPAVMVVIIESNATACGFKEIFIFVLAAEDGLGVESGFARDVQEGNAKIAGGSRSGNLRRRRGLRKGWFRPLFRKHQSEYFLQREHDCGTAE